LKNLKFSFIVLNKGYNKYIRPLFNSILKQTYSNWEVIFIDYGIDVSYEALDYVEDSRFKLFHFYTPEDREFYAIQKLRNKGVELSTGDLVSVLDLDSILESDYIESFVKEFNPDIPFYYCNLYWINETRPDIKNKHSTKGFIYNDFSQNNRSKVPHTSSPINRKHFIKFDENLHKFEDWDMILTLYNTYKKPGKHIDKYLFTLYQEPGRNRVFKQIKDYNYWFEYLVNKHKNFQNKKIIATVSFGIGNSILKIPALRAIKSAIKDTHSFEILCYKKIAYDILSLSKDLKPYLTLNPKFNYYDTVIELPPSSNSLNVRCNRKILVKDFKKTLKNKHEVVASVELAKEIGWNGDIPSIRLELDEKTLEICQNFKEKFGEDYICINNASLPKAAKKRLPLRKFIHLVSSISDKFRVIIIGGPHESEYSNIIPKNGINLVNNLNLEETIAILKNSKLLISTDSGLMHLADAIGTKVIAIFGPTIIEKNYPWNNKNNIIKKNIECRPCWWTDRWNSCYDNKCMDISIKDILSKIDEVLNYKKVTTFITTYRRPKFLKECLKSLEDNEVGKISFIYVIADNPDKKTIEILKNNKYIDDYIISNQRRGISFGVNIGIEIAKFNNSRYVNYLQEDMIIKDKNWLEIMISAWEELAFRENIGCLSASVYPIDTEYMKHLKKTQKIINFKNYKLHFRKHISAQNIFMPLENWKKYFPIDYIDPISNKRRGFPNDGIGSRLDWWISLDAPNSLVKENKWVCCIEGLLEDRGFKESTWKKR